MIVVLYFAAPEQVEAFVASTVVVTRGARKAAVGIAPPGDSVVAEGTEVPVDDTFVPYYS